MKSKTLTPGQVLSTATKRLKKYDKLSFLVQYGIFMGKIQIVEAAMKQRLESVYGYDPDKIEKWTLGQVIKKLEQEGLWKDFVVLLSDLLEYRNYFSHEFLSDHALMGAITGINVDRLSHKRLVKGLFKVEETIIVHDFLVKNSISREHRHDDGVGRRLNKPAPFYFAFI